MYGETPPFFYLPKSTVRAGGGVETRVGRSRLHRRGGGRSGAETSLEGAVDELIVGAVTHGARETGTLPCLSSSNFLRNVSPQFSPHNL